VEMLIASERLDADRVTLEGRASAVQRRRDDETQERPQLGRAAKNVAGDDALERGAHLGVARAVADFQLSRDRHGGHCGGASIWPGSRRASTWGPALPSVLKVELPEWSVQSGPQLLLGPRQGHRTCGMWRKYCN